MIKYFRTETKIIATALIGFILASFYWSVAPAKAVAPLNAPIKISSQLTPPQNVNVLTAFSCGVSSIADSFIQSQPIVDLQQVVSCSVTVFKPQITVSQSDLSVIDNLILPSVGLNKVNITESPSLDQHLPQTQDSTALPLLTTLLIGSVAYKFSRVGTNILKTFGTRFVESKTIFELNVIRC